MRTLFCKTCKVQVGVTDQPDDGQPHYCSLHVPQRAHDDPDHPYAGAKVQPTPPLKKGR